MNKPTIVTIDLESVLIPEIWIEVAEKTGIDKLRLTTRDIPDYDELMAMRLGILKENKITLDDIKNIANETEPLEGAVGFLNWLRKEFQLIIVSDTFYEFAKPVLAKLGNNVLFCHSLEVDKKGMITGYALRESGEKKNVVKAFKQIGFEVIAIGDSFNDVGMLTEADFGLFLHASPATKEKYPNLASAKNYEEALKIISKERELVLV